MTVEICEVLYLVVALSASLLDAQYYVRPKVQQYVPEYEYRSPQISLKKVKAEEPRQDFSKIPGEPGVDYPLYHEVPETGFSCGSVPYLPGMYANVETGCQAYHVCHDGREGDQGAAFLCTNGTLFNQKEFTCDWWYNVDCKAATSYYELNGDLEKNPYAPKPKKDEYEPKEEAYRVGTALPYYPVNEAYTRNVKLVSRRPYN